MYAIKAIIETYDSVPKSKDILKELDQLQEKKNTLMQEYSKSNDLFSELVQYKKNYENYMDKGVSFKFCVNSKNRMQNNK